MHLAAVQFYLMTKRRYAAHRRQQHQPNQAAAQNTGIRCGNQPPPIGLWSKLQGCFDRFRGRDGQAIVNPPPVLLAPVPVPPPTPPTPSRRVQCEAVVTDIWCALRLRVDQFRDLVHHIPIRSWASKMVSPSAILILTIVVMAVFISKMGGEQWMELMYS